MVIHSVVEVFDLALVAFQEESGSVAEGLSCDGDLVFHIAYIAFWFDFRQGLFCFRSGILLVDLLDLLSVSVKGCHSVSRGVLEVLSRFVEVCDQLFVLT
jgi:hypothetical protein